MTCHDIIKQYIIANGCVLLYKMLYLVRTMKKKKPITMVVSLDPDATIISHAAWR